MIFNCILENHIFTEILVTLLPHLEATNFIFLKLKVVFNFFKPLVELLNVSILLFNHCFCSPVNATTLAVHGVLPLNCESLVNVILSDALGRGVCQVSCLTNLGGDVLTPTYRSRPSSCICTRIILCIISLPKEFSLEIFNSIPVLFFDYVNIAFEFSSLFLQLAHGFILFLDQFVHESDSFGHCLVLTLQLVFL